MTNTAITTEADAIKSEDPITYATKQGPDMDDDAVTKFVARGAHALSDAELLSIFLRNDDTTTADSMEHARDLLTKYQGWRGLLDANRVKLQQDDATCPAHWVRMQAALELGTRWLESEVRARPVMSEPDRTKNYVKAWICRFPHEVFACLFLDNRHRIIKNEIMFTGTIDGASVYPREVVKRALEHNAAAIIFAHNHPSGIAEPSQADKQLTLKLTQALGLLDIRVLDHLVVGDKMVTSMAERGLM